ncbi:MAG: nickel pincer cofactor biosynthesis protein LarC, partial [Oscillospiraceae bacterium]|nr:nickel pincer cofactor biosynthesis protein LarC [Oscillospiraceae bacterium]
MKTLYFECGMGAAGDMLLAALLELLPDRQAFLDQINGLGLPGVHISAAPGTKCGITGTQVTVTVHGEEEDHHHHHEHHHHSGLHDIEHIIEKFALPEQVKKDALAVYRLIAEAESHAHGRPVDHIHFHEVGTLDAIADITGVCLAAHLLAPERVLASPVHVGCGQVRCVHGILPVPAPATAHILRGAPIYGGKIQGELCTPTGAALLKHFACGFGEMPVMRAARIGYGMGKKDFEAANCVRAFLGDTEESGNDEALELRCNLDDMTGEAISFAQERLLEGGALEVFTTAVGMKKGRPGVLLTCLCRAAQREDMLRLLFRHTTTLGVRE